jgi:hypothetical protein
VKRLVVFVLIAAPFGCQNSSESPKAEEKPKLIDRNNIAGGGTIQSVRAAPGRILNANDLQQLHIFLEASMADSGQLPDKNQIVAQLKSSPDARKLVKDIDDGYIVLTGNRNRESIWAYEKNAPTNGGFVLSNSGVEKLSAAEVTARLKSR